MIDKKAVEAAAKALAGASSYGPYISAFDETRPEPEQSFLRAEQATLRKMARAALQAAMPWIVPEGWVVVPREPTPPMLDLACDGVFFDGERSLITNEARRVWSAMISAAPPPGARET